MAIEEAGGDEGAVNVAAVAQLPNLSSLARVYLGIPSTSVSSERLFSKTGLTISERRTSLNPEHAEQIAFLSQNWSIV